METTRNKRKLISLSMIGFELRTVISSPYTHIFGVGMPIFMAVLIAKISGGEINDPALARAVASSIFLGIGCLIPLATILMGYAVSNAQEIEKGIPQRMDLFGITAKETLINRAISEAIFMLAAFLLYFVVGFVFLDIEAPVFSGIVIYFSCMIVLGIIFFCLAHALSTLIRKFGATYCVVMLLYFAFMMLSGMMGLSYDNMPNALQHISRMLPTTYINKDFLTVWEGEPYQYGALVQSFLLLAAVSGILLFISLKKNARRKY